MDTEHIVKVLWRWNPSLKCFRVLNSFVPRQITGIVGSPVTFWRNNEVFHCYVDLPAVIYSPARALQAARPWGLSWCLLADEWGWVNSATCAKVGRDRSSQLLLLEQLTAPTVKIGWCIVEYCRMLEILHEDICWNVHYWYSIAINCMTRKFN